MLWLHLLKWELGHKGMKLLAQDSNVSTNQEVGPLAINPGASSTNSYVTLEVTTFKVNIIATSDHCYSE